MIRLPLASLTLTVLLSTTALAQTSIVTGPNFQQVPAAAFIGQFVTQLTASTSYTCNGTDDTGALQALITSSAGVVAVQIPAQPNICVTTGITLPTNTTLILNGEIKQKAGPGLDNSAVSVAGDNVAIIGSGIIDGNAANMTGSNVQGGLGNGAGGFSGLFVGSITIQNTVAWPFNILAENNALSFDTKFINGGHSVEYAVSGTNDWFINPYVSGISDLAIGFYGGVSNGGIVNAYVQPAPNNVGIFALSDAAQPGVVHDIQVINPFIIGGNGGIEFASNYGGSVPYNLSATGGKLIGITGASIDLASVTRTKITGVEVENSVWATGYLGDIVIGSSSTFTDISHVTVTNPGQGSVLGCGVYEQVSVDAQVKNSTFRDTQTSHTMNSGLCGRTGTRVQNLDDIVENAITAADLVTYESSSSAVIWQSPNFRKSTNTVEIGLPSFDNNLAGTGKVTGYNIAGLQFGWNYSGGNGENDLFMGPGGGSGGLDIHQLNASGGIIGPPVFSLTSLGALRLGPSTVAALPTCTAGQTIFASNGRNNGETAGNGTGLNVTCNSAAHWIAPWSGLAVTS